MRDRFPFSGRIVVKRVWHCAPSRVAGEHSLFRFGRIAVFCFKKFERPDGGEIVAGLFMQSALTDAVGVSDSEIAGGCFFQDRVEVKEDSGYRGSSLGRNAHSRVASSQASWYCIFFTDSRS